MAERESSNLGKYASKNPVVQGLLDRYFATLTSILDEIGPTSVLDVGCGEGVTAGRLGDRWATCAYRGLDLDAGAVADARARNPGLDFAVGSALDLEGERADVVVCLEVLEHLADPASAVAQLHAAAGRWVVVSVPWEPWFRLGNLLRGKYLANVGNHPEHVQQFGPGSIRDLVASRFVDVQVRTSFPWVFVWARKE
jgi:SAM-dependent methyltransferase